MNKIYRLLLPLLLCLLGWSCTDDFEYDLEVPGEGNGNIRATVSFTKPESALDSRAAGNAVGTVNNLWIVLYKVNVAGATEYYAKYEASSLPGYKVDQQGNSVEPGDVQTGSNLGATGEKTPHADFSLSGIPYGKYKIYAVANVASLSDEDVATEEALKSMTFTWNTDVSKNNAMFGYFTSATSQKSQGFNAPTVTINRKSTDLHSWIKRLVSKVTVAFDPSELKEAVTVYIKSVTIHDIPRTCALGETNTPDSDAELITTGESINYYTAATANDHTKWGIVLQKASGVKGAVNHTESDEALYFFENMQGNYPGDKTYLKEQIPDETGTSIDAPDEGYTNDYKDRIRYGTYIEVIGYYLSQNTEKMSSGVIKYRFMLGKDIYYDYDAERNFHYKLTLKLRGFANEADWHISYTEPTPSLYTPQKYYISYLYGRDLNFPVRVLTGDDNVRTYTLKSEIIENNWWPYDPATGTYPQKEIGNYDNINGFAWNIDAYNSIYKNAEYVGFLALRKPASGNLFQDMNYGVDANKALENYYITNNVDNASYSLASEGSFPIAGNSSNGNYSVKYDQDKSVTVVVPMYTRQKEMVPSSDFTGNNPYGTYQRSAKVRFTLWDANNKQVSFKDSEGNDVTYKDVPIFQVRRIDNPKAIYRAHNNSDPFNVHLVRLPSADATKYEGFASDGPWRASILVQTSSFVKLSSKDKSQTATSPGQYITGSTGSEIEFTYEPNGTIGEKDTRCAIILVEYHDYTCHHLIFVRQGYNKGVKLGNANWSCYHVYATGKSTTSYVPSDETAVNVAVTRSPLSIGSFLKRNQYNFSILESNNANYGWLKSVTGNNLTVAYLNGSTVVTKTAKWDDIQGYAWKQYNASGLRHTKNWADTWTTVGYQAGQNLTVPTAEQFVSLMTNCDFGYGVAYADGATEVATDIDDAFGYTDYANTGVRSSRGVRVCVAYDKNNGNNILFPLGSIGQGRRAISTFTLTTPSLANPGAGALTYSGGRSLLSGTTNQYRPLTYNLYRYPGAIYWIKQPVMVNNLPSYASWDINYFTFVFNHYDTGSLGGYSSSGYSTCTTGTSSDALPIKLVYK